MDLQFKKGNHVKGCLFNSTAYAQPLSTLSSTNASAAIQENLDLDLDMLDSLAEASQFMSGSVLYNEKELRFLNSEENDLNLIRGQSGRCVYFEEDTRKFCREMAIRGTESCPLHEDEECTKTGQAIREMGALSKPTAGFSIMRDVYRWNPSSEDHSGRFSK